MRRCPIGYTNYVEGKISKEQMKGITADFRKVLKLMPAGLLSGPTGEGSPVVNNNEIAFNGAGGDDFAHESCCLPPEESGFTFCKTARKPYDIAVKAVYLLARYHAGVKLHCDDGGPDTDQWRDEKWANEGNEGGSNWYKAKLLIREAVGKKAALAMEMQS